MKKSFLMAALFIISVLGISASFKHTKFKNLKVLPGDITKHQLDSMMSAYCKALSVKCDFCHSFSMVENENGKQEELDFAADTQMKEQARNMIRMMIDINQKYFYFDKRIDPVYLNAVSCNTCHRGNPFPLQE
jgi:hypothetical protein